MKQKTLFSVIGALVLVVGTMTMVAGCRQSHTVIPVVGAVIELPAGVTTITIEALSANGDPITVEGCAETSLTSNTSTTLHVTGSSFVLKGDITDLSCDNGNITNLDVRGLPNLNTLSCDTSHVKSLNVQGLTKLNTLSCGNNELESLDLSGLSALTGVDCQNNKA